MEIMKRLSVVLLRLKMIGIFAMCVCVANTRAAAGDASDLVFQAYKNRGNHSSVIKTCFVEFSLVSQQPVSEAQYKKTAERRKEFILKTLEGHKDPEKLRVALEKSFRENQLKPQQITGTYLHRLSEKDQQRQSLFSIIFQNQPGKQSTIPTTVISETGPQRIVSAMLEPQNRMVRVLRIPCFIADFYQMGRIDGDPINNMLGKAEQSSIEVTNIIKDIDYHTVEEEKYDNNSLMTLVEYKKNGRLVERYGIDSSKGYICPLIQIFDEKTGKPTEEYTSQKFFLHEKSGLWFPSSYTAKRYDVLTGELVSQQEYIIDTNTLKINQPVSEQEFSIDIPTGFKVDDSRVEEFTRYVAHDKGAISLARKGLDLENMEWLSQELPEEEYMPSPGGAPDWVRWTLMSIGGILILYALGRMLYERIWKKP